MAKEKSLRLPKLGHKVSISHTKIPFVTGIIGGILSIIGCILFLIASLTKKDVFGIIFGIIGIIFSGAIIYSCILLKDEDKFKLGRVLLIVSSVIALLPGVLVGPLVSLTAGILAFVKRKI